jgi:subtilisin family serine protease
MKKGFYLIGLSIFVLILSSALQTPDKIAYVEGEVLVKFRPSASAQTVSSVALRVEATAVTQILNTDFRKIKFAKTKQVESVVQTLKSMPEVEYAEPNYIYYALNTPNDPSFDQLWGLENTGQSGGSAGADISAVQAWDVTTGSDQVLVGIVDTGIDYTHEDLADNIYRNPGEDAWANPNDPSSGNGIDDDGNGMVDDWIGWNFIDETNVAKDDNMHGTHVAGTVGAIGNNGKGVVGVNWKVKLMPLKFLGYDGSGTTEDAIEAIIYATDMGAKVLNNSWGGGAYSQALLDAIKYANDKGVLFVVAAGNDGTNNDVTPTYPANYDVENVISVAASDRADQRALWGSGGDGGNDCGFNCSSAMAATPGSNYGPKTVHLAAPGKEIYSSVPGGYSTLSGTSMATPHVVGAAALLLARDPSLTAVQLKQVLMNSVDVLPAFEKTVISGGRLNIAAALESL